MIGNELYLKVPIPKYLFGKVIFFKLTDKVTSTPIYHPLWKKNPKFESHLQVIREKTMFMLFERFRDSPINYTESVHYTSHINYDSTSGTKMSIMFVTKKWGMRLSIGSEEVITTWILIAFLFMFVCNYSSIGVGIFCLFVCLC